MKEMTTLAVAEIVLGIPPHVLDYIQNNTDSRKKIRYALKLPSLIPFLQKYLPDMKSTNERIMFVAAELQRYFKDAKESQLLNPNAAASYDL